MKQMQEVAADRIVIGLDVDAAARVREVIPVKQHRAERRHQTVGDVARFGELVLGPFGQHRAQCRACRAHHIHRMRIGRNRFKHALDGGRDCTQTLQLALVGGELG